MNIIVEIPYKFVYVTLHMVSGLMESGKIPKSMDSKRAGINLEGEINRNSILNIIRQDETEGVTPDSLRSRTHLSRQAIHMHLKILSSEGRVYKRRRGNRVRYFPQNNLLNDADLFAFTMADRLMYMIDKELVPPLKESNILKSIPGDQPLYQYPSDIDFSQLNPKPGPHEFFLKAMSGYSVSEDYCTTKFTNDNTVEKNLFEFANRVGTYIAYIFIEALRPVATDRDVTEIKKEERIDYLINKAIPIERLFRRFCDLLRELGIMSSIEDSYLSGGNVSEQLELNESSLGKLSDSFRRVYPRAYKALENFWFNSRMTHLKRHSLFGEYSRCRHKWEEYHLYKIGRCYICNKCHLLAERRVGGRGKNKKK